MYLFLVLNSFMSSNCLFKLCELLNVNIHHRNESLKGWVSHFLYLQCSSVVCSRTCPIERDLRIKLPSLWAVGGGGIHDWNNTLVIGRHCNTVVIVTIDWSVRQQGFCQKWQQKMVWGVLPSAVLPGGLGQKDMREMDQFLYEKDISSVCRICVPMALLRSVVSRSYCMLVPVHV